MISECLLRWYSCSVQAWVARFVVRERLLIGITTRTRRPRYQKNPHRNGARHDDHHNAKPQLTHLRPPMRENNDMHQGADARHSSHPVHENRMNLLPLNITQFTCEISSCTKLFGERIGSSQFFPVGQIRLFHFDENNDNCERGSTSFCRRKRWRERSSAVVWWGESGTADTEGAAVRKEDPLV